MLLFKIFVGRQFEHEPLKSLAAQPYA